MTAATDTESRPCRKCDGNGEQAKTGTPCLWCAGEGTYGPLDYKSLFSAIVVMGSDGARLRKTPPRLTVARDESVRAYRQYFVWRLARNFAGLDSQMPMKAILQSHHDPYFDELMSFAEQIADSVLGIKAPPRKTYRVGAGR